MSATSEKHAFQAEVNEVLSLVVNSLYSHREVFLRELISNAADAIDQLSFRALTDHDLLGEDEELTIELVRDKDAGTLTIRDNGIGMSHDELIGNLGTIARSGSKKLAESLSAEQKKDITLIREVDGLEKRFPVDYKRLVNGEQENIFLKPGDTLIFH